MGEDLLKIINYYGIKNQQKKLQEEVFELQEAIYEYEFKHVNNLEHVKEEIADVLVLIEQLVLYYDLDYKNEILKKEDFKIKRQLERIDKNE